MSNTTTTQTIVGIAMVFALTAPLLYASEINGTLNSNAGAGSSSQVTGNLAAVTTTSSSEIGGSLGAGQSGGSSVSGTVTGGSSNTAGGGGGGGGGGSLAGTVVGGSTSPANNSGGGGGGGGGGGVESLSPGSSLALASSNDSDFGTGEGFDPELESFLAQYNTGGGSGGPSGLDDLNNEVFDEGSVSNAPGNDLAASIATATDDGGIPWVPITVGVAIISLLGYGIASAFIPYKK
ncbi:MAG: hypothetical protein AAB511_01800 [Patescibacteria group bacterium]|mgnify:CR=1 FL=1